MSVAGNADPMLGYLTTSFREHPRLRHQRRPAHDIVDGTAVGRAWGAWATTASNAASGTVARLYAAYAEHGGDRRSSSTLEDEGHAGDVGAA